MFSRKQNPSTTVSPLKNEKLEKQSKDQSSLLSPLINLKNKPILLTFFFLFSWLLLLFFRDCVPRSTVQNDNENSQNDNATLSGVVRCKANFSVYVYDLPPEFNSGLLEDCKHLNIYTDMCPYVTNQGLGRPINVSDLGVTALDPGRPSWFATHQFIGEMIFHARVENHPCRTRDPSRASLFYVPFYGGLHASSKFREANLTQRDDLAVRLANFLTGQPWFQRSRGRDHFLALGRTAWDFMRVSKPDTADFGSNGLLNLPTVKNMSVFTVERNPWNGKNQHGIPYPSYFHPYTLNEMSAWQNVVRRASRPNLFSFIGGPRKGLEKAAIRDKLIEQCSGTSRCELLKCGKPGYLCHNPVRVLAVMKRSVFCLQAPGDSFTRRSTFDAILAGCVPVFFSAHTAYTQYAWFVPAEAGEWSVYLGSDEGVNLEEALAAIAPGRVERMRETVIRLIPRLTFAHPNATAKGFDDAVDVTLASLASMQFSSV